MCNPLFKTLTKCVEEGILQKLPFVVHDILRVLNCFKGFTLTHREAQNV